MSNTIKELQRVAILDEYSWQMDEIIDALMEFKKMTEELATEKKELKEEIKIIEQGVENED